MLKFTGHALVDVGLATIAAFSNKPKPEDLDLRDLNAISDYMSQNYTKNPLRSYLTVAFPNSGFTQPAFFNQPDKQETYKDNVLRAFNPHAPRLNLTDVFTGLPVTENSLDVYGNLTPGRAFRQHIPLLTGEDVINFFPGGIAGMEVSGETLLAIQALPLGSAKCQGKMLFVHSDNPEIIRYFANKFLQFNLTSIQLARLADDPKMPEPYLKHQTLLMKTLTDALVQIGEARANELPFSITAYHLSNSGQGSSLDITYVPNQVIAYMRDMLSADYKELWGQLVERAWEINYQKRNEKEASPPTRNFLYEDLFNVAKDVYQYAASFIRMYFLRDALIASKWRMTKNDPRSTYSLQNESNLISWRLTEPFLRRIIHMDKQRIENIRQLGDALAEYVQRENDRSFFRNFYTTNNYEHLRIALIKANTNHVRRGNAPFLTLDNYISIFQESEELVRVDWKLARDLVLIRLVEQLHKNHWLGANQDLITEEPSATDSD